MAGSLDILLGQHEHATFHDAIIVAVHVDYSSARFVADVDICVGDPDARDDSSRERRRRGQLIVDGLKFWFLEPPGSADWSHDDGLWLTSDGALAEAPTEAGQALARAIDPNQVNWFLYFSNLNAFGYLAGTSATFSWS